MNRKRIVFFIAVVVIIAVLISWYTMAEEKQPKVAERPEETTHSLRTGENSQNSTDGGNSQSSADDEDTRKKEILAEMLAIPMEDFEAVDLDGNKVKLSDYKGKIIFLNFWATWCPPCREEMQLMEEVYSEYKDKDVVILAVSPTIVELRGGNDSDKAERIVKAFVKSNGYTFPFLLDKDNKAWSIYQQRGIPVNYIIDKQGLIRYGFSGAFTSKEQMYLLIDNIRAIE